MSLSMSAEWSMSPGCAEAFACAGAAGPETASSPEPAPPQATIKATIETAPSFTNVLISNRPFLVVRGDIAKAMPAPIRLFFRWIDDDDDEERRCLARLHPDTRTRHPRTGD